MTAAAGQQASAETKAMEYERNFTFLHSGVISRGGFATMYYLKFSFLPGFVLAVVQTIRI